MNSCIPKAIALAEKYYDAKTLAHAYRVAKYAYAMGSEDSVYACALLHDIIEDTPCTRKEIEEVFCQFGNPTYFYNIIAVLTHDKQSDTYEQYIDKILMSNLPTAIDIKRADMKDHLMQVETLTPKLIEKYIPVIGKLM